jgi:hypothetical protein
MERKDQEQQPGKEQPAMPQPDEERESMAQERDKRKPDEQNDETVGKVPDPQDEEREQTRDKS